MSKMLEVYKKYAVNYDELVSAEDYKENLNIFLNNELDWKDTIIYEAGIGTGRITKNYIEEAKHCYGFDREEHMLNQCKENLKKYLNKITLNICDNTKLNKVKDEIDVFIEGWSFGHTIHENSNNLEKRITLLVNNLLSIVNNNGKIIIIESAGTNVEAPIFTNKHHEKFYNILENEYGFKKTIITTDYKYPNYHEAGRIMGFFFGDEMEDDIINNKKEIIKEFTGIWVLDK